MSYPGEIPVPAQDSADNNYIQDVAGNKTDTVAGTSLVALNKINKAAIDVIDAFHDVPAQDSVDNVVMSDVLGNKTDTHSGGSLYGQVKLMQEHLHNQSKVYPDNCTPITLTTSATPNTYGTIVEIVPASTIASDLDLHWLSISDISADGYYQIALYTGAISSEVLLTEKTYFKTSNFIGEGNLATMSLLVPANTRISAAIKGSNSAGNTCKVRIEYHTY